MLNNRLFSFESGFKATDLAGKLVTIQNPFSIAGYGNGGEFSFDILARSETMSDNEFNNFVTASVEGFKNYEVLREAIRRNKYSFGNKPSSEQEANIEYLVVPVVTDRLSIDQSKYDIRYLSKISRLKSRGNVIPAFNRTFTEYFLKRFDDSTLWDSCMFEMYYDDSDGSNEFLKTVRESVKIKNSIIKLSVTHRIVRDVLEDKSYMTPEKHQTIKTILDDIVSFINDMRDKGNIIAMTTLQVEFIVYLNELLHKMRAEAYDVISFDNFIISNDWYWRDTVGDITDKAKGKYTFKGTLFNSVILPIRFNDIIDYNDLTDESFGVLYTGVFSGSMCHGDDSIVQYSLYKYLNDKYPGITGISPSMRDIGGMIADGVTNFKNAYIEGPTVISHTDLKGMDFTNATLRRVIFVNCTNFDQAIWNDAKIEDCEYEIRDTEKDETIINIDLNRQCDGSCQG